jgi:DNA polymerase III alpha subunit
MSIEEKLTRSVLLYGPEILKKCLAEPAEIEKYLTRIYQEKLDYPIPKNTIDISNWFIPNEYKNLDIEEFLINQCPKENNERLIKELKLYRKHNMLIVLKAMKYIVDTLRKHNIVWGVGRGSSVASYALFLIGVHKIDSVKYNLPIEEFFKEI